jgi:uncharacterized membrane protein
MEFYMNGDEKKKEFKEHFKTKFIQGIFIVLPLGITYVILRLLYNITAGIINPFVQIVLKLLPLNEQLMGIISFLVSIIIFFFLIYSIGLFVGHFAGRRALKIFESLITDIPVLNKIYFGAKNIVDSLNMTSKGGKTFSAVVIVEFPRVGVSSVGFVTGEIIDGQNAVFYKVFVPTAPNPTSGFLVILPEKDVIKTSISVETGIKMIVSGGVLSPEKIDKISFDKE